MFTCFIKQTYSKSIPLLSNYINVVANPASASFSTLTQSSNNYTKICNINSINSTNKFNNNVQIITQKSYGSIHEREQKEIPENHPSKWRKKYNKPQLKSIVPLYSLDTPTNEDTSVPIANQMYMKEHIEKSREEGLPTEDAIELRTLIPAPDYDEEIFFKHLTPSFQEPNVTLPARRSSLGIPTPRPKFRPAQIRSDGTALGGGGRKTASAMAIIKPGTGKLTINGKAIHEYFHSFVTRDKAIRPLVHTEQVGQFDVLINVKGGGTQGQAGAISHALANALTRYDPGFKYAMKKGGFLTRDPRKSQPKTPGKPKARKSRQWSKR